MFFLFSKFFCRLRNEKTHSMFAFVFISLDAPPPLFPLSSIFCCCWLRLFLFSYLILFLFEYIKYATKHFEINLFIPVFVFSLSILLLLFFFFIARFASQNENRICCASASNRFAHSHAPYVFCNLSYSCMKINKFIFVTNK